MYVCYLDESGDPGPKGSEYLLLGGAALFEGRWSYLRDDIDGLISKYFPAPNPRPPEIHMADLRRGKRAYRTLTPTQRNSIQTELCNIATSNLPTELRFFGVVAHKPTWFAGHPGKTGDDLYAELFEDLTNRFDLFLRRRNAEGAPSKGIMIADPHKQDLSKALKSNYSRFQRSGTRWGRIYNLIETVFFLASEESPGLQLADLCSFAIRRLLTANDDQLVRPIHSMFDREPFTSGKDPGKWHGIKSICNHARTKAKIDSVWLP